jgi:hypothetical protein
VFHFADKASLFFFEGRYQERLILNLIIKGTPLITACYHILVFEFVDVELIQVLWLHLFVIKLLIFLEVTITIHVFVFYYSLLPPIRYYDIDHRIFHLLLDLRAVQEKKGLFLFLAHPEDSLGAHNEDRVEQDAHRRRHDDGEAAEEAGRRDLAVADRHHSYEHGPQAVNEVVDASVEHLEFSHQDREQTDDHECAVNPQYE